MIDVNKIIADSPGRAMPWQSMGEDVVENDYSAEGPRGKASDAPEGGNSFERR